MHSNSACKLPPVCGLDLLSMSVLLLGPHSSRAASNILLIILYCHHVSKGVPPPEVSFTSELLLPYPHLHRGPGHRGTNSCPAHIREGASPSSLGLLGPCTPRLGVPEAGWGSSTLAPSTQPGPGPE